MKFHQNHACDTINISLPVLLFFKFSKPEKGQNSTEECQPVVAVTRVIVLTEQAAWRSEKSRLPLFISPHRAVVDRLCQDVSLTGFVLISLSP